MHHWSLGKSHQLFLPLTEFVNLLNLRLHSKLIQIHFIAFGWETGGKVLLSGRRLFSEDRIRHLCHLSKDQRCSKSLCKEYICVLMSIIYPWKDKWWLQINDTFGSKRQYFKELECLGQLVLRAKGFSAIRPSSERLWKTFEPQAPEVHRVPNQVTQSETYMFIDFSFLLYNIQYT